MSLELAFGLGFFFGLLCLFLGKWVSENEAEHG